MASIPDLPSTSVVDGDQIIPSRAAVGDEGVTIDQIVEYANSELTPAEVLAKTIAANPSTNGLDANFLQGLAASYFTNAANLTGTAPESILPQGSFSQQSFTGGLDGIGGYRASWSLPPFLAGGVGIRIQMGYTVLVNPNTQVNTTFLEPFSAVSEFNKGPLVFISPSCFTGDAFPSPRQRVEVDIRVQQGSITTTGFTANSIRTEGANTDRVRGYWFAFGAYS